MNRTGFVLLVVFAGVFFVGPEALGQTDIESLIEQTGVEPGPVASRDFPGWREPRKIIVRDIGGLYDEIRDMLPGVEFVRVLTEEEAIGKAAGADAILGFCGGRLVQAATDAIWIQVFGAGVERCLTVDKIRQGEVMLTNMQKMSSPVIGEHVVAMALGLSRGLIEFSKSMSDSRWLRNSDIGAGMQSYGGKTVLIAGLGGIGTEAARRFAALDMRVIGTRRSSREGPDFVEYVGLSHELFELAAGADFIVNALPHTPETEGLFNAEFFNAAKRGAYFINVGRGKTVVTRDLIAALESGQIAGAALDVTDPEPLPKSSPLWQMDNVIITPHVSGRGGNRIRHNILVRENLRRFVAGDALLNVVDPELGY
ncbi:MAG: D-2-hydroxyacid dehydrogenase [Woeseiaceae bacterium]|nr:D-2-hydroxyacid dehydrogenase [Woeseiaceae bacterium]NIP21018.1 D-2-hydroxyacid dehydrogenase [Woeseiaceae bacterium]NIS89990.1 D-2-hydroxyacid dehydrogenase [Woeseiaceae bacterium]